MFANRLRQSICGHADRLIASNYSNWHRDMHDRRVTAEIWTPSWQVLCCSSPCNACVFRLAVKHEDVPVYFKIWNGTLNCVSGAGLRGASLSCCYSHPSFAFLYNSFYTVACVGWYAPPSLCGSSSVLTLLTHLSAVCLEIHPINSGVCFF